MTYSELFEKSVIQLKNASIEEASSDVTLLFDYILGVDRAFMFMNGNDTVPDDACDKLLNAVSIREKRVPLQHITGFQNFMGLEFKVSKDVLVPRFDTECLVEEAMLVTNDILAYEEIDKEQASTDQTKTFEKYYSILIEDENASSEMNYLIRAVNSKNQESKEHSIKSRKLNLPSVSVNLGLSEANFADFKNKLKIDATLSVFSKDNLLADASLTIKGRGNSSWFNAPKKSYTIKFEKKQEFLGFASNKSFALIANYFDKTLLRNITAYSLAKKFFTKMSWAPSAKTVNLFIDGVYQGLYSAVESVKIAKNRVNIPDISDFVSSQETTNFEDL